jgi:hypothetical protein
MHHPLDAGDEEYQYEQNPSDNENTLHRQPFLSPAPPIRTTAW